MATNLVIVESAAKAKTIQKYLNEAGELKHLGQFKVMACLGHVRDLPKDDLGVDTQTWAASYTTLPEKYKTVKALKEAAVGASRVYLASDPDREGASIAKHLQELLKLSKSAPRLVFHEITPAALVHAVLHPTTVDAQLVAAQETRRILDRVVGYELSPLLWRRFRGAGSGLSAGRVQSAALKLLVDRAAEQASHTPTPYWVLHGSFTTGTAATGNAIDTRAHDARTGKLVAWSHEDIQERLRVLAKRAGKVTWTASFEGSDTFKKPPPPFTTSSLQQEAYNRYGIPAKRTMQLAQTLYEAGFITYMRTDSTAIAKEAQAAILRVVRDTFGDSAAQPRAYKTSVANAQEAHEAIRPTKPAHTRACLEELERMNERLTPAHLKLYGLIWSRAVASQMVPAKYATCSVTVTPSEDILGDCVLQGQHSVLVEPGFLAAYAERVAERGAEGAGGHSVGAIDQQWQALLAKKEARVTCQQLEAKGNVTQAPSQYNEPQLVKMLEKHGIGRPSTFATILDKLVAKGYVAKGCNPQSTHEVTHYKLRLGAGAGAGAIEPSTEVIVCGGKEADKLVPTSLGQRVNDYLKGIAPFLLDTQFTAEMEADLDRISNGAAAKEAVLNSFYGKFHPVVAGAQEEQKRVGSEARVAAQSEKPRTEPSVGKKRARGSGKQVAKAAGGKPASASPTKAPLRDFPAVDAAVLQTRYGLALFHRPSERFVSLAPFLEWRKVTLEDLTERDARFLVALPLPLPGGGPNRTVALGRYGLYVKDGDKNVRLPRSEWDGIYNAFESTST